MKDTTHQSHPNGSNRCSAGVLETILDEIKAHDQEHDDHGIGCACHDRHAGAIRRLVRDKNLGEKSRRNLHVVLSYLTRNP